MPSFTLSKEALDSLVVSTRKSKLEALKSKFSAPTEFTLNKTAEIISQEFTVLDKYGNLVTLNSEQAKSITLAKSLESQVLLGPAGTGKTTTVRGVVDTLITSGLVGSFHGVEHKYLPASDVPGIVAVSFTRRAVANLAKSLPQELQKNCLTIHALLECEPGIISVFDSETGEEKNKQIFAPKRNETYPLSEQIQVVIIDEASMVGTDLFKQLDAALPHKPTYIFIGDICQLPPIFGPAILGFKMLELPVIQLTQVYRQALESPIIKLATDIRTGQITPLKDKVTIQTSQGHLTLHPWKKRLHAETALLTFCKFITQAYDLNKYNPEEDMILCPFNKSFGTIEINKHIANHIARKNNLVTYEIQSGYNKIYLSPGDKILFEKRDAKVISIKPNPQYLGVSTSAPSTTLDYWGYDPEKTKSSNFTDLSDEEIESVLDAFSDQEEKVNQASHIVTIKYDDTDYTVTISTAAKLNSLLLSYALTVHKAQGSEWRKVILAFHQSHNTMLQRELLYTAVTRAKEELYIICEPDTFVKGVQNQRIKGDSLEEKIEYFKGKLEDNNGNY